MAKVEWHPGELLPGAGFLVTNLSALAERARAGDAAYFHDAPRHAPRRRLDETRAARRPVLRWRPPEPGAEAAG